MNVKLIEGKSTDTAVLDGGKTAILGIPVSTQSFALDESLEQLRKNAPSIVTFVNPHACKVSEADDGYVESLLKFDWVLCDGIGMVIAAKRKAGIAVDRAAFDLTSLAGPVCSWLAEQGIPIVLVGGKPGVSVRAAKLLTELFPRLAIVGFFSGYAEGPNSAMKYLHQNPHLAVICGMGAPRQEQFLLELCETNWVGIGFTCGGFFDQLVDRIDYYPEWIDNANLRFIYRLWKEPHRLWKRYLIEYQVFLRRYMTSRSSG